MSEANSLSSSVSDRIDEEMRSLFGRYLTDRSPLRLDDYGWHEVRPDVLDKEFIDGLTFVTLVESNPTAPSEKLLDAADRSRAPWLRQFIILTWLPEESMHPMVFREYLVSSGTSKAFDLDKQMQDTYERGFELGEGYSELQAATYGWLQELITWRFYESMRNYLVSTATPDNPTDMVLVRILGDVAKQENFHRFVYLSGIRTVLKHAPQRKWEVVSAASEFLMPGHHMAPSMQKQAPHWSAKFGFSHRQLARDIVADMITITGYRGLAQAAIGYAVKNEVYWYLKIPGVLLAPFSKPYWSPVNALVGRALARMYG